MSVMAYIRRSIITSPVCQNDPLTEMEARGAVKTYGSLRLYFHPAAAGGTVVSLLELA